MSEQQNTNPMMDVLKLAFENYTHQIATQQLRIILPESHLMVLNMIMSETIKNYRLWPDNKPAANAIRLDFIYHLTGSGGGLSELPVDQVKALWHLLKPNRDMQSHWHMFDDTAIKMCAAMRTFYEAKLPHAEQVQS